MKFGNGSLRNCFVFFNRLFVIILVALSISSCAVRPTPEQLTNADYGAYPNNYEELIKSYANSYFKDPSSAQWNFTSSPTQQWSSFFGGAQFGYGVCAEVNAKNSFGGYNGYKTHYFLIKNGRVIQHIAEKGGEYDIEGGAAHQRCGG